MKIDVYVNWDERKVCDYENFIKEKQNEVNNYFDDLAGEWLDVHYTSLELFNLTDSDKEAVKQKMENEFLQDAIDNTDYQWEIVTIEI